MADVDVERVGQVLVCRLNRPDSGNPLTGALLRAFVTVLDEARADDQVRVVVTTGVGRMFSVGGDFGDIAEPPADASLSDLLHAAYGDTDTLSLADRRVDRLGPGRQALAIRTFDKPTIAAVNGPAAGGGFAVAMLHDFRIASDLARFTTAFIHLGLVAEMGLSHTLLRAAGPEAAMELFMTGRQVGAQEAQQLGIVGRVVPHGQLEEAALELATRLAAQPPLAVQLVKRTLLRSWDTSFTEQLDVEWPYQVAAFDGEESRHATATIIERHRSRQSSRSRQ
jgi:2-(1,2-epoxy-1,2-dihydrophenyl)acetyl-CoA isomerase